ncbi:hypothetical protein S40288_04224 [Stachybotrys chartarum IBT 40288]|nr:hypothetical protein S40288_04224 [Stachybotrys chartarum IBT 40288]
MGAWVDSLLTSQCDESKPHCKRCISFGVSCNSLANVPDLHPLAADSERPLAVQSNPMPLPPISSAVWTCDEAASYRYQLNAKCQDFITRYLGRSLITPNDPKMKHVNRGLLRLAFTYPFLMHASLAVALTYDRYLNTSLACRRSAEECYHWSQSTALLNKRLQEPIKANERDAIWATAAAISILTYASPDAYTPSDSWPLNLSDSSDLDWLRMSKGKMSLWNAVNPLRPDSLFSVMAETYARMDTPLPGTGIDGIPQALAAVCSLDHSSTAASNPYFHATHAVSQALNVPDCEVTTAHAEIFTRAIRGPFKDFLQLRDPVALLLLYLWYRKAGRCLWWIELRARVECPAICLYLRFYHMYHSAVQEFLPGGALADISG